MSKIWFESVPLFYGNNQPDTFNGNKLVIDTPREYGSSLYIQTVVGDRLTLAWVRLTKKEAQELAARLAYEAQFLEDEDEQI